MKKKSELNEASELIMSGTEELVGMLVKEGDLVALIALARVLKSFTEALEGMPQGPMWHPPFSDRDTNLN